MVGDRSVAHAVALLARLSALATHVFCVASDVRPVRAATPHRRLASRDGLRACHTSEPGVVLPPKVQESLDAAHDVPPFRTPGIEPTERAYPDTLAGAIAAPHPPRAPTSRSRAEVDRCQKVRRHFASISRGKFRRHREFSVDMTSTLLLAFAGIVLVAQPVSPTFERRTFRMPELRDGRLPAGPAERWPLGARAAGAVGV